MEVLPYADAKKRSETVKSPFCFLMFLTCMIFRLLMFDTISEHAELGHALMAQVVFSSMCNPEYEN